MLRSSVVTLVSAVIDEATIHEGHERPTDVPQ
jgi:hypothetical protein